MTPRSAVAGEPAVEGLEDLSPSLRALRFQGPAVVAWLSQRGITCPEPLFATKRQDAGRDEVLVARVGGTDLLLQGAPENATLRALEQAIAAGSPGVFSIPEHATTLRLAGLQAEQALAQACALQSTALPLDRVVYTRVVGVSCAILPEEFSGARSYRFWVDYSYAPHLWRSLAEILGS